MAWLALVYFAPLHVMMSEYVCKDLEKGCRGATCMMAHCQKPIALRWEIQIVKDILIVYVMMDNMIVEDKSNLGLKNMFGEAGVLLGCN
jgi:hypothetical protein